MPIGTEPPITQHPSVSVVIPSFDEGQNTRVVVENSIAYFGEVKWANAYEIIVVNDGSRDETREVVEELSRKYPQVRGYHHTQNIGLGAALKTGFSHAIGDYVSFIPSDGEVKIDQVITLLDSVSGFDICVGRRSFSDDTMRERVRPWFREVLSWGYRVVVRSVIGFDPGSSDGIFVIRGDILRSLPILSDSGTAVIEIVATCHRRGLRINSGITDVAPRLGGKSKVVNVGSVMKSLGDLLRIRWRLL